MMTVTVDSLEADAVTFEEVGSSLEDLLEGFRSLVKDLWVNLMREEISLYELCEVLLITHITVEMMTHWYKTIREMNVSKIALIHNSHSPGDSYPVFAECQRSGQQDDRDDAGHFQPVARPRGRVDHVPGRAAATPFHAGHTAVWAHPRAGRGEDSNN